MKHKHRKAICIILGIIILLGIYKHLAKLYVNPDNAIYHDAAQKNEKVIDFVRLEQDDELIYIYHTENSLVLKTFTKEKIFFWHSPYQSTQYLTAKYLDNEWNDYFVFGMCDSDSTFLVYGCCIRDDISAIHLILDNSETLTYQFENDKKLFCFDLGAPCARYQEIKIEVIDTNQNIAFSQILYKQNY